MRTISTALQAHFQRECQTITNCWRVVRRDGTTHTWTDHDVKIVRGGATYIPFESGIPSNYTQNSGLAPSNMDLEVSFSTETNLDVYIRAGLFDYADIETFKTDWTNETTEICQLAKGKLGEVEIRDNQARIEIRSLTQILATPLGSIYTPECRTSLGSTLCKIATTSTSYTKTGTISSILDYRNFFIAGDAAGQIDNFYNYGKITFNSGENNGIVLQVEDYTTSNLVTLIESAPFAISSGTSFTIVAGCDRRSTTCQGRFSNILNYRGFPRVPGGEALITTPSNAKWTEG